MTDDEPTITVSEGGLELPVVDVLTGRGAMFGKSGSGKSNSVGVIAEQLLDQEFPLVIIDADGEHYGLKEQYELLHVGATAEQADAAVTAESARPLATLTLEEDIAVILDVSEFTEEDREEVILEFVDALFQKAKTAKKPLPVFIEEAHELIPETNYPDETAEALIRIAKRGRKRGLGVTVISQRPANVNKDVITQADWSVWHRLWYPNDTKVVRDILGPEYAEAVQDLDVGEAIVMADWLGDLRTVKFKRKKTFDAGETPGLDEWTRPELKSVSPAIIGQLQEVTEEQERKEDKTEQLETELEELHEERRRLEREVGELRSGADVAESEEVQQLQDDLARVQDERDALADEMADLEADLDREREQRRDLEDEVVELRDAKDALEQVREELRVALATAGADLEEPEVAEPDAETDDRIAELERELDRLRERNEQLRESDGVVTIPDEYEEFYEHPTVEQAIEGAVEDVRSKGAGANAVWGVVLAIADAAGPVGYDTVSEMLGHAGNTQTSKAASSLASRGVIREVDTNPKKVDFAFDNMAEIERKHKMREEMERRIEQKVG